MQAFSCFIRFLNAHSPLNLFQKLKYPELEVKHDILINHQVVSSGIIHAQEKQSLFHNLRGRAVLL